MNTNVKVANNKQYMLAFTYITNEELKQLIAKNNSVLLGKNFYDSCEEAIVQAEMNKANKLKLHIMRASLLMSDTVFDKMCTLDVNAIEEFYNQNSDAINKAYAGLKEKKRVDLETFTI